MTLRPLLDRARTKPSGRVCQGMTVLIGNSVTTPVDVVPAFAFAEGKRSLAAGRQDGPTMLIQQAQPHRRLAATTSMSPFAFFGSSPTSSRPAVGRRAPGADRGRWMLGQGMATLAAAIVAVIAINGAFSFWQEYRRRDDGRAAASAAPPGEGAAERDDRRARVRGRCPRRCHLSDRRGGRARRLPAGRRIWRSRQQCHDHGQRCPLSRDARPSTDTDLLRSRNVLLAGIPDFEILVNISK